MPVYEVELDDGRVVDIEGDQEPTHDDVYKALGVTQQPTQPEEPAKVQAPPGSLTPEGTKPYAGPYSGGPFSPYQQENMQEAVNIYKSLGQPAVPIPPLTGTTPAGKTAAGVFNVAKMVPEALETPLTYMLGPMGLHPAGRAALAAGFGIPMIQSGIKKLNEATQTQDLQKGVEGTTEALFGGTLLHLPKATQAALETINERIPDASQVSETTEVHGDVRPQQEPTSTLPVQEGEPGVQPQAQTGVQGQAPDKLLLTPEQKPPEVSQQGPGTIGKEEMGAAGVEEIGEGSATGLKNVIADAERAGLGLAEAPEHERQNMAQAWARSADKETTTPGSGEALAKELLANPERRLTGDDSALLLRYKRTLLNKINDAAEKTHVGDQAARAEAQKQHDLLTTQLGNLLDAVKQSGSAAGLEFRWRQALAKEDFTFESADEMNRYYRSLSGRDMVPQAKPAAEEISGAVKDANKEADTASGAVIEEIKKKSPPTGPDIAKAERDAQDAAWRAVRENAIRVANLETKERVATEVREQETARIQKEEAQKALDKSQDLARDQAIKAARAEQEVKEQVRLNDQAKAAKSALDAATKRVREQAKDLADAENAKRMAKTKQEKAVASIQEKAAKKALAAVDKLHRDAAIALAKAQRELRGDPIKAVWNNVREQLDRGEENFDDIRNKAALDLGMKVDSVTRIMAQDKTTKRLMDEAWRKQQQARLLRDEAKRWVAGLDTPQWEKYVKSVPRVFFGLKTFGHGTVPLGTHAPFVLFDPRHTVNYLKRYGTLYHMVADKAFYERQMQDLKRRPNYIAARRGGLVNDPSVYEDYTNPELVKYITGGQIGTRGFSVLKILRQDMFDSRWNKLPKSQQTDAMASSIADAVNHITGVTKAMSPRGIGTAFFAPRLFGSRVAGLALDPARAAWSLRKTVWGKLTPEERQFAVEQLTSKALIAGTLYALLQINQGILMGTGSKQRINTSDPMKSDFLKFKADGMDFAYGNALLSLIRMPASLYRVIAGSNKMDKIVYDDERWDTILGRYARSQLSPFMGTLVDLGIGSDFESRPLPSKGFGTIEQNRPVPKRLAAKGYEQYSWPEYWSEQLSPIPGAELIKEVWRHGLGLSEQQVEAIEKAVAASTIMAATGGRVTEDIPEKQPGPYETK